MLRRVSMRSYPRSLVFLALVLGALGLGGCVAGNGLAGVLLLAAGVAAGIAGCGGGGARGEAPGSYECCENGRISRCSCDAAISTCNYAPYRVNGDGTCTFHWDIPDASLDVAAPAETGADMSTDTPADLAADVAPDVVRDAGEDRPFMSYRCCPNGRIETCYCPPLTACNYGLVVECGDGTCYESYFPNLDAGSMCKARDGGGQ